jgi:hypothetical protein
MKAKRKQLNLSGSKELRERLEELAIKFKRRSGSTVALEIVQEYIDFWEVAENNRQATKQQQKAALMREVASNPNLAGKDKIGDSDASQTDGNRDAAFNAPNRPPLIESGIVIDAIFPMPRMPEPKEVNIASSGEQGQPTAKKKNNNKK